MSRDEGARSFARMLEEVSDGELHSDASSAVRLRYRVSGGRVIWSIVCHRADKAFAETVEEAAERVREGTGLPLFFGHPEP